MYVTTQFKGIIQLPGYRIRHFIVKIFIVRKEDNLKCQDTSNFDIQTEMLRRSTKFSAKSFPR